MTDRHHPRGTREHEKRDAMKTKGTAGREPAADVDLTGRRFWKSLEARADTPEFREAIAREFPAHAAQWDDPRGRREFLTVMGASIALAGLTGCTRQPKETIAPFAKAPENTIPGRPLHYATSLTLGGLAVGAVVEAHEGRPTKVEGNPLHPASLGASDPFMQGAVLGLYDPDRSRTLTHQGRIRPRGDLVGVLSGIAESLKADGGAGLRILTRTVASPTLAAEIEDLLALYPNAAWHQHEPANRENTLSGTRAAFGEPLAPIYRTERADVIVSLDADFLTPGAGNPMALADIRGFARRRNPDAADGMNRLYVVESMPTNTGAMADHRLPLRSSACEPLARALAAGLGLPVLRAAGAAIRGHEDFIDAVVEDLRAHGRTALVIPGERQPPAVHLIAHAINASLGAIGTTVEYITPPEARPERQTASLARLVEEMNGGRVSLLLILGGNPVYDAPVDLDFRAAMEKVALRVHLSPYQDETTAWCQWHVPMAHELESWGDERAADGTISIRQPMIEPLYAGVTEHEVLDALLGHAGRSAHDILRERWRARLPEGEDFDRWWRRALHDGVVAGTAHPAREVTLVRD